MVSTEFIFRIGGMIVLGIIGGFWGFQFGGDDLGESLRYALIIGLIAALAGLVLTPYFTTRPAHWIRGKLSRLSAETLFAGLAGLVVGLLVAALLAFPLSLLPPPLGQILPFVGVLVFT